MHDESHGKSEGSADERNQGGTWSGPGTDAEGRVDNLCANRIKHPGFC